MAQFERDFAFVTHAAVLTDEFTPRWAAASSASYRAGRWLIFRSGGGITITNATNRRSFYSFDPAGATVGDFHAIVILRSDQIANNLGTGLVFGASGSAGLENGYAITAGGSFSTLGPLRLARYSAGVFTLLATASISFAAFEWYTLEVQRSGSTIRARLRATGSGISNESFDVVAWDIVVSDSVHGTGRIGLFGFQETSHYFSGLFLGTEGDAAPRPGLTLLEPLLTGVSTETEASLVYQFVESASDNAGQLTWPSVGTRAIPENVQFRLRTVAGPGSWVIQDQDAPTRSAFVVAPDTEYEAQIRWLPKLDNVVDGSGLFSYSPWSPSYFFRSPAASGKIVAGRFPSLSTGSFTLGEASGGTFYSFGSTSIEGRGLIYTDAPNRSWILSPFLIDPTLQTGNQRARILVGRESSSAEPVVGINWRGPNEGTRAVMKSDGTLRLETFSGVADPTVLASAAGYSPILATGYNMFWLEIERENTTVRARAWGVDEQADDVAWLETTLVVPSTLGVPFVGNAGGMTSTAERIWIFYYEFEVNAGDVVDPFPPNNVFFTCTPTALSTNWTKSFTGE